MNASAYHQGYNTTAYHPSSYLEINPVETNFCARNSQTFLLEGAHHGKTLNCKVFDRKYAFHWATQCKANTSFSTELAQLSHKVEYYHVLSRAPYTWAKHAAHHTQADFFLIDPSLDHRAPPNGLQDHRSWRRHFQHQSRPLLGSLPWNFTFPSRHWVFVFTTGPTILSRAPHISGSPEKKRINEARNKIPKPLTFSLPPFTETDCGLDQYRTIAATSHSSAEGSFILDALVSETIRIN